MSTKMYLRVDGGDGVVSPPVTWRGGWDQTTSATNNIIDPQQFNGLTSIRTIVELSIVDPFKVALQRWCTRPLAAQTISGTLDFIIGVRESLSTGNMNWKVYAYARVGVSDVVRGVLLDYEDNTTEWPTTVTGMSLPGGPAALSSVAIQDGDTVVIEMGYIARNTTGSSHSGSMRSGSMLPPGGLPLDPMPDLTVGSTNVTTEAGTITFSHTFVYLPPANDSFAGARILTASEVITQDLMHATWNDEEPTPCNGGASTLYARHSSVWYQWDCPVSQNCTVIAEILDGLFTFDTVLMVLTGTPGSFVTVDCRAENDPDTEQITFAATGGVTYYILVMTVYYGGGQLTFTFSPDVEPVGDETVISMALDDLPSFDEHTSMGWIHFTAPDVAVRHFWYIGVGTTPFVPGEQYVWVGTDADGVTLTLNIYDGTTVYEYTGPVLSVDTWYHWAYVKVGNDHYLYLSTESGGGRDLDLVIGPITQDAGFTVPELAFVYGLDGSQVPKSFKMWSVALTTDELRTERETYRSARHADAMYVGQWRSGGGESPQAESEYSGFGREFGGPLFGGGTIWELIRGPRLDTLPARPFFDDFEDYLAGAYDGTYTPGVVDPATNYEGGTDPTVQVFVATGAGPDGSQAASTRQTGYVVWFEHDEYEGRCGNWSAWCFKRSDAQEATRHGIGVQVDYLPESLETDGSTGFGFLNVDPSAPPSTPSGTSLFVYNTYPAFAYAEVPDVYVLDQWQFFQFFWTLSTVDGSQTDVNADGSVTIMVDGEIVYEQDGLQLTGTDVNWPNDVNTWNTVRMAWNGFIDTLNIGTQCYGDACPGELGAPRTGA